MTFRPIPWPSGPFAVSRSRGIGLFAMNAAFTAILGVLAFSMLYLLATQVTADDRALIRAGLGAGTPDASLTIGDIQCRRRGKGEVKGLRNQECMITVLGDSEPAYLHVFLWSVPTADTARPVRLGDRIALRLSGKQTWLHLLDIALNLAVLSFILAMAASYWLLPWAEWAPLRRPPEGSRIISVDLLDRAMISRNSARWRLAYDHDGQRRYARATICDPPILSCGTVTRGAALLLPNGQARMLVHGLKPLDIPPERRAAAEAEVDRQFNAHRPPVSVGFDSFLASLPPGRERDYVAAWREAWEGRDVPQINAALERRYAASRGLKPHVVDALLARCRAYVHG
jgi:hypothetical protein